jgi:hypothetical protein
MSVIRAGEHDPGKDVIPADSGKITPVANPALPTSFGCVWSAKGYAAAVEANDGQPVQHWPCLVEPGKLCAGLHAANFLGMTK